MYRYGCPYAAMYAIASEGTEIPSLPDQFSEAARDFVATCLKRYLKLTWTGRFESVKTFAYCCQENHRIRSLVYSSNFQ